MAGWLPLPSTLQKRFLSYALSRTGIFDETALDLDKLDLTWGSQNVIQVQDVALSIPGITKLATLPPELRLTAASAAKLRLAIPADILRSTIVFDLEGITVDAEYEASGEASQELSKDGSLRRSHSPSHRKTARRIPSPYSKRSAWSGEDVDAITVQDMARSFLLEKSPEERKQLEDTVAAQASSMEDSTSSASSDASAVGTGGTLGLPAFLANFLQGVVDRVQINLKDISVLLSMRGARENLGFNLSVSSVRVWSTSQELSTRPAKRQLQVDGISLDLLHDTASTETDLTGKRTLNDPQCAPSSYQAHTPVDRHPDIDTSRSVTPTLSPSRTNDRLSASPEGTRSQISIRTTETDRFADIDDMQQSQLIGSDYDIRPGEDNISWGSRRTQTNVVPPDMWSSVAESDDVPDSLLLDSHQRLLPAFPIMSSSSEGSRTQHTNDGSPIVPRTSSQDIFADALTGSSTSLRRESSPEALFHDMPDATAAKDSIGALSPERASEPDHVPMQVPSADSPINDTSVYMSVMTHESPTYMAKSRLDMPGGWTSEFESQTSLQAASAEGPNAAEEARTSRLQAATADQTGFDTPRAQSPGAQDPPRVTQPRHKFLYTVRLVEIDGVRAVLSDEQSNPREQHGSINKVALHQSLYGLQSTPSVSRENSSVSAEHDDNIVRASMKIGRCHVRTDVNMIYTLLIASTHVVPLQQPVTQPKDAQRPAEQGRTVCVDLHIDTVLFDVLLSTDSSTKPSAHTLSLELAAISLQYDAVRTAITAGQVSLTHNGLPILMLQHEQRLAKHMPVLEITYATSKVDMSNRPITEIDVATQILRTSLDIDEILRSSEQWGSISGLLEAYASATDKDTSDATQRKSSTVVRFDDESAERDSPDLKINVRVAGCQLDVRSHAGELMLRTTSIKVIHRQHGSSVTVAQVRLDVPSTTADLPHNSITLEQIRIDLLNTPADKDLERFLALLTPSKDKYENDEDILLDTLLRQRKKGSCLRINIDACKATVADWDSLVALQGLSHNAARLTAVAKYLPEDDRPGILSMIRIKDVSAHMPTTPSFGPVLLTLADFQCAHVGVPALVACALSDLRVRRDQGTTFVQPLIPLTGADSLPMLMVRMVGDTMEPTIEVKMHNIGLEYSVTMLIDLMGRAEVTQEQIVNDLSRSVADMALSMKSVFDLPTAETPRPDQPASTDLMVLIHDCGLGLQPQKLSSKAYLVLTAMKISLPIPSGSDVSLSLSIRQAGFFITTNAASERPAFARRVVGNTATTARVVQSLSLRGYVSIASIMSALIKVDLHRSAEAQQLTEVVFSNELLILETCADSTHSLFALLSDLAPPTPPSQETKYLTEPMTLDDMMASFTGEPVANAVDDPNILFDVDTGLDSDNDLFTEASELMTGRDDILAESELTSSLYGPVSGLLGDIEDDVSENRPTTEAAESLLEEDPFVMTVTPDDLPFSDTTLLKDLRDQFQPSLNDETVVLGNYEIEDLGFDPLGPEMHVLGQKERFTLPIPQQLSRLKQKEEHVTVKVRVRDTNFLWNLHDGYDWQTTRERITDAVEQVELRAEERFARRRTSRGDAEDDASVIGDCLFNSIYIGVPSNAEAQDIRRQINRHIDDLASETESVPASALSRPTTYSTPARPRPRHKLRLERSRSHKIAFELKGVCVDFTSFMPEDEVQSSIDVRVKSFEIFDNVPTSTWRKFLTQLVPDDGMREISRPMVHAELFNVRTIQDYAATEMILRVSLTPLRLHVDQDALDFITRFFEFKDDSALPSSPSDQPFLQRVEVDTVDLRLDYKPKKVDYAGLRSGHTTEFMNFVILDAANIKLKHAIVYGIKGFGPLHKTLNDVWMPDVRRNQLPIVLAGLAPVRSLVNIGSGVRDVVAIPIREYKKDGRIMRSIQKGAFQFGKTTASELARLGAKVAIGTQNALQGAEGLLVPSRPPTSRRISSDGWHEVGEQDEREQRAISAYADQPLGVLSGLQSARRFLEHDLLTARDALIAVQGEILNSDSAVAAATAVARHAPTVILRPIIGASRAVGTTLLGVGNQIDRDNLSRMDDKYKRR